MRKRPKADLYLPRPAAEVIQILEPIEDTGISDARPYTVDHLPGGCVVIGLPGGQAAWKAAHKSRKGGDEL